MQYIANTNRKECTLLIQVATRKQQRIKVVVENANKPMTVYTARFKTFNGTYTFQVKMPQAPDVAKIHVFDMMTGDTIKDGSFTVKITRDKLKKEAGLFTFDDLTKEFVKFAQEFAENASIYSFGTGNKPHVYCSDKTNFRLHYYDKLTRKDGRQSGTPARIGASTGIIDVNRSTFLKHTVPGRVAILLHEYCHIYKNKTKENENEADMNALMIYLALGYPRYEARLVFLRIFYDAVSDTNMKRYNEIKKLITRVDNKDKKMGAAGWSTSTQLADFN